MNVLRYALTIVGAILLLAGCASSSSYEAPGERSYTTPKEQHMHAMASVLEAEPRLVFRELGNVVKLYAQAYVDAGRSQAEARARAEQAEALLGQWVNTYVRPYVDGERECYASGLAYDAPPITEEECFERADVLHFVLEEVVVPTSYALAAHTADAHTTPGP